MKPKNLARWSAVLAACTLSLTATLAVAAEPLKVGLVLPMSGPFSSYGKHIENGARLYLQQTGGVFSGRKVELIIKDDTGVAPEISKRAAQELIVKDKVDVLAGFGLTPSAFAVAPIATQAKTPMIIMNAATSSITTKSDYILRVSHTLPQDTAPIASWAAQNKIKKVYTLVADFGPGHDAEAQFKKTFTAAGGEVIGEVRTPVKNPDFAPFHYSEAHNSPENKAYVQAYYKAYPGFRPNFMSVSGYDGMQLIAKTLEKTGGDASGDKFVAAAKGMSWTSPRGPISIDPQTRDIIQTIYIRKVERVGGKLQNVEFDEVPNFKDPGKQ